MTVLSRFPKAKREDCRSALPATTKSESFLVVLFLGRTNVALLSIGG